MLSNSGHDENNKYTGGRAGDQTGTEWTLCAWYSRPWNCVLRHPDATVRAKIAQLSIAAAKNNQVGYNQGNRNSYWTQLQKNGYDPSKITVACDADCSAGVIANVKATGYLLGAAKLKTLSATYTGNMRAGFKAAGFEVLTDSKYLTSDKYLLAGDVLLNDSHHTAVNVTDGALAETGSTTATTSTTTVKTTSTTTVEKARFFDKSIAGRYKVKANGGLNVRTGAGTEKSLIGTLSNGSTVRNWGYWSMDKDGVRWLYIDSEACTGFVSSKYLIKS